MDLKYRRFMEGTNVYKYYYCYIKMLWGVISGVE